jgi:hypothetical protein
MSHIYVRLLAFLVWALSGVYLLVLLCLCMNIKISICVLKTSATFLALNIHTMIVPLVSFIFSTAFLFGWLVAAVYIFSVGEIVSGGSSYQWRYVQW